MLWGVRTGLTGKDAEGRLTLLHCCAQLGEHAHTPLSRHLSPGTSLQGSCFTGPWLYPTLPSGSSKFGPRESAFQGLACLIHSWWNLQPTGQRPGHRVPPPPLLTLSGLPCVRPQSVTWGWLQPRTSWTQGWLPCLVRSRQWGGGAGSLHPGGPAASPGGPINRFQNWSQLLLQ